MMELEKLAQSIPLEGQQPAAGRRRGRHRAHRVSPAQTRMDLREVNCHVGASRMEQGLGLGGGAMPKTSLLLAAALLCFALPAWGQELPEGKGKDLVAAQCTRCQPLYGCLVDG